MRQPLRCLHTYYFPAAPPDKLHLSSSERRLFCGHAGLRCGRRAAGSRAADGRVLGPGGVTLARGGAGRPDAQPGCLVQLQVRASPNSLASRAEPWSLTSGSHLYDGSRFIGDPLQLEYFSTLPVLASCLSRISPAQGQVWSLL